jgi:hypothetical protein
MQNLLRAAAEALANLSERAHRWADQFDAGEPGTDPERAARDFAGVDLVGIDFSTSIRQAAGHVIRGWDRYRAQVDLLRAGHGVWVFGVNAVPFPLTRGPVPPRSLPTFCAEHFQPRGHGRGLIEYGSAFYDYLFVALGYTRELGVFDEGGRAAVPVTISLLCDGWPNGGLYQAGDVRPLLEEARARGVRFRVVAFARPEYRAAMGRFCDSLGLTDEEAEVAWYEADAPDWQAVSGAFDSLSSVHLAPLPRAVRRARAPERPPSWEGDPVAPGEWDHCRDPQPMLAWLRADGRAGARKLRLFACACCWRLGPLLGTERRRRPIEAAERFADGLASLGEMEAAAHPVPVAVDWVTNRDAGRAAVMAARAAVSALAAQPRDSCLGGTPADERAAQAALVRCLFGSAPLPGMIPAPVLAWGSGAAVQLAESIYEGRRFEDLPVLADFLEKGGLTDPAILAHCRDAGPHTRGCWVLDAILRPGDEPSRFPIS